MRCVSVLVLHIHNSLGQARLLPLLQHGALRYILILIGLSLWHLHTHCTTLHCCYLLQLLLLQGPGVMRAGAG